MPWGQGEYLEVVVELGLSHLADFLAEVLGGQVSGFWFFGQSLAGSQAAAAAAGDLQDVLAVGQVQEGQEGQGERVAEGGDALLVDVAGLVPGVYEVFGSLRGVHFIYKLN